MTKQDPASGSQRRTQAERNAATRKALVGVARELFGAHGYEHVGTERIVRQAGVTRGAMYHHFKDKRGLFEAVFELVEAEATEVAARAALGAADPRSAAMAGASAYLDYCLAPDIRRILFVDSRAVLDDARLREITEQHGGAVIRAMVAAMIEQNQIRPLSIELLSAVITGMLIEGAAYASDANDQSKAVTEVTELFDLFLAGIAPG